MIIFIPKTYILAAPIGNQFWRLRSKHGRDKLFATPELLWEAACEYFEWCQENPWMKSEAIKSGEMAGQVMEVPTERPMTLHALCLYLDCSLGYFRTFKLTCSEDFLAVIEKIEKTIYTQKFEGASVGVFNANIIARDLGLKDHSDVTSDNEQIKFDITLKQ